MKINEYKKITGKIKVLTGLHIGAGNDLIEIGGMDSPVIKDPVSHMPYIPGSSLKGKLRSLMEWHLGKIEGSGNVHQCPNNSCPVCVIFGSTKNEQSPTRIIVRDSYLTKEWKEKFYTENIFEEKAENNINRISAKATPRKLERVVKDVEFELEINFKIIEQTDENLIENLKNAMKLLELDCLGGGGSRGSGKIQFVDLKINGENLSLPDESRLFQQVKS